MTRHLCATTTPRYRELSAATGPDLPLEFYLLENLLTARAGSCFPTNGAGPDEDVNVYLAHLLSKFVGGDHDPRILSASGPVFAPPAKTATRRDRVEHYRRNADHRLLHLGLFGRGDALRRRQALHRMSAADTRTRDAAAGQACYEAAANLARGRCGADAALVSVWMKLAAHFDEYVHVLGALATRHLGWGAQITDTDLARLLPPDSSAATRAVADLLAAPPPPESLDALLDLWSAHNKNPSPAAAARIRDMANRLGVELILDGSVRNV